MNESLAMPLREGGLAILVLLSFAAFGDDRFDRGLCTERVVSCPFLYLSDEWIIRSEIDAFNSLSSMKVSVFELLDMNICEMEQNLGVTTLDFRALSRAASDACGLAGANLIQDGNASALQGTHLPCPSRSVHSKIPSDHVLPDV